jgi:hypothetical protein
MSKHVLLSALALAAVAGHPAPAHAVNPNQLVGNCAVHATASCLGDPVGFNGKLQALNPSESYISRYTTSGVVTFNPPTSNSPTGLITGTETRDETVRTDTVPASPLYTSLLPNMALGTFSDTGVATYQIEQGSDTITVTFQNEVGSIVEGPRAGETSTIDSFETTGYVSADGKTIVLTSPDNTVEHITYSGGGLTAPQTFARLCHRSTMLVKIQ